MATWPDSKYKRILVLASLMEGMVMKEKAASACFMDLSLVPAIPEARHLPPLVLAGEGGHAVPQDVAHPGHQVMDDVVGSGNDVLLSELLKHLLGQAGLDLLVAELHSHKFYPYSGTGQELVQVWEAGHQAPAGVDNIILGGELSVGPHQGPAQADQETGGPNVTRFINQILGVGRNQVV